MCANFEFHFQRFVQKTELWIDDGQWGWGSSMGLVQKRNICINSDLFKLIDISVIGP